LDRCYRIGDDLKPVPDSEVKLNWGPNAVETTSKP
jgi:hypothetical protein